MFAQKFFWPRGTFVEYTICCMRARISSLRCTESERRNKRKRKHVRYRSTQFHWENAQFISEKTYFRHCKSLLRWTFSSTSIRNYGRFYSGVGKSWGLCDEGHEFLRLCRKRSPDKTKHLIDVLVTQHAKWIASRLRRALFGQSTSSAVASQQSAQLTKPAWKATSAISTAQRTQNNCGHMKRLKAAFSNFPSSVEATKVGTNVGQNGGVFPPSPQ